MRSPRTVLAALLFVAIGATAVGYADAASSVNARRPTGAPVQMEINKGQLLRLKRPAASVFIANPAIADISVKSPRLIYVFGKRPGETTLFAVDSSENIIADMRIRVVHNISGLNSSIKRLAPDSAVRASSIDGGIVLSGKVHRAADADNLQRLATRFLGPEEQLVARLDVTEAHQVNIRVRVAEVSRELIRQFGINWDVAVETGSIAFGIATGNPTNVAGTFLTRQAGVNNGFFQATPGDLDLNALIDSLATDSLITVLAEPNLTALSGETATFLAGGEFPIPVSVDDNEIGIEFKEFGVSLSFTPTILNAGRISMRVRPEVSQLSTNGAINIQGLIIPALSTRRAETTVELGSGQSFAIAGMMLDRREQIGEQVPGLSDIPILGRLFDSDRFQQNETELVIIVTPYLVRPVSDRNQLAVPTDTYFDARPARGPRQMSASPRQQVPLASARGQRPGLVGPAGFRID
jgi:pilus assembly protein CpaC